MKLVKLVKVVIFIINSGWKCSYTVLFADNVGNNIKIYVIQIDQMTTMTYTLYLLKSQFLNVLANIVGNDIKICAIQVDLEKTITYTTYLYKFK